MSFSIKWNGVYHTGGHWGYSATIGNSFFATDSPYSTSIHNISSSFDPDKTFQTYAEIPDNSIDIEEITTGWTTRANFEPFVHSGNRWMWLPQHETETFIDGWGEVMGLDYTMRTFSIFQHLMLHATSYNDSWDEASGDEPTIEFIAMPSAHQVFLQMNKRVLVDYFGYLEEDINATNPPFWVFQPNVANAQGGIWWNKMNAYPFISSSR